MNTKQTPSKPKTAAKPKAGLKVRTTVKAGDPGMRLNHSTKLVSR